jgi:hypothetical protein
MHMRRRAALACFILLCAAGCSDETAPQAPDRVATPTPAPAQPPASTTPAAPTDVALVPLTAEGWGPLRVGMTLDQITAALGPDANPDAVGGADTGQCDQFRPSRAPEGMLLMVEEGRLTRISLSRNFAVKTDRGLGLGVMPAQVTSVYGSQVRAEPHKYQDPPAQYLTVWSKGEPGASDARGIRYEVDGSGKVAQIHAGGPSIQYVEGCA